MIIKSLSRKDRSFSQLVEYMADADKSNKRFDLHHNCFARGERNIAGEFFANSEKLKQRKNGNYMYHEVVSISVEEGVQLVHAKECLREMTLDYISKRCPRNMVYGCLHDDHSNQLHYHLMISANERDEQTRLRLPKKQFDTIKRQLEEKALKDFPELKQKATITAPVSEKKESRKAREQTIRGKKLSQYEDVKRAVFASMVHCNSFQEFSQKLLEQGFEYYKRGSRTQGVKQLVEEGKGKAFRFNTLGIESEFNEFISVLETLQKAEKPQASRQEPPEPQPSTKSSQDAPEAPEAENRGQEKSRAGEEKKKEGEASRPDREDREKSRFMRDMEEIQAKKKAKRATKAEQAKTMKQTRKGKPRSR